MNKALETLRQFKDEFPNLYKLGEIANKLEDGNYNSMGTDLSPINCYGYFQVKNNEITAIGEERGRDGGWFWFK